MKRRQAIRYAGAGLMAALGTGLIPRAGQAQSRPQSSIKAQWLGHTCFFITGAPKRMLINPFKPIGCTANYRPPRVATDLVMISSQLLDEGFIDNALPGDPQLLIQPGIYEVGGMKIQGVRMPHDRIGGRRFGFNIAWQWRAANLNLVHLGGAAAPIDLEQKILLGRPDVLFLPVGNGPKAYGPAEAKQAVDNLNPRLIIPTHYRTQAADPEACDIVPLEEFLTLMQGTPIRRSDSDSVILAPSVLPSEGRAIQVLSYAF